MKGGTWLINFRTDNNHEAGSFNKVLTYPIEFRPVFIWTVFARLFIGIYFMQCSDDILITLSMYELRLREPVDEPRNINEKKKKWK